MSTPTMAWAYGLCEGGARYGLLLDSDVGQGLKLH
jgi:hypothetical protein